MYWHSDSSVQIGYPNTSSAVLFLLDFTPPSPDISIQILTDLSNLVSHLHSSSCDTLGVAAQILIFCLSYRHLSPKLSTFREYGRQVSYSRHDLEMDMANLVETTLVDTATQLVRKPPCV